MKKNRSKNSPWSYRDRLLKIIKKFPDIENSDFQSNNSDSQKSSFDDLVKIAVENRRISRRLQKNIDKLDENMKNWMEFSITKISEILTANGIQIFDYIGKKYIEGMNWVEIISVEKTEEKIEPKVIDCLEPGIIIWDKLYKKAKVVILSS